MASGLVGDLDRPKKSETMLSVKTLLPVQGRADGGDGGGSFQWRRDVEQRARGGNAGACSRESVKN